MPTIYSQGKIPLKDRLYNMYMNGKLVDTKILLKDGTIKAHSIILGAESPIMYMLLEQQDRIQKTINMKLLNKLVMRNILTYMYKGIVTYHKDDEAEFLSAAEFLGLEGIDCSVKNESVTCQSVRTPSDSPDHVEAVTIDVNSSEVEPTIADKVEQEQSSESPDFTLFSRKRKLTVRNKNQGDCSKKSCKESTTVGKGKKKKIIRVSPSTSSEDSIIIIEDQPTIIGISDSSQVAEVENQSLTNTTIRTDVAERGSDISPRLSEEDQNDQENGKCQKRSKKTFQDEHSQNKCDSPVPSTSRQCQRVDDEVPGTSEDLSRTNKQHQPKVRKDGGSKSVEDGTNSQNGKITKKNVRTQKRSKKTSRTEDENDPQNERYQKQSNKPFPDEQSQTEERLRNKSKQSQRVDGQVPLTSEDSSRRNKQDEPKPREGGMSKSVEGGTNAQKGEGTKRNVRTNNAGNQTTTTEDPEQKYQNQFNKALRDINNSNSSLEMRSNLEQLLARTKERQQRQRVGGRVPCTSDNLSKVDKQNQPEEGRSKSVESGTNLQKGKGTKKRIWSKKSDKQTSRSEDQSDQVNEKYQNQSNETMQDENSQAKKRLQNECDSPIPSTSNQCQRVDDQVPSTSKDLSRRNKPDPPEAREDGTNSQKGKRTKKNIWSKKSNKKPSRTEDQNDQENENNQKQSSQDEHVQAKKRLAGIYTSPVPSTSKQCHRVDDQVPSTSKDLSRRNKQCQSEARKEGSSESVESGTNSQKAKAFTSRTEASNAPETEKSHGVQSESSQNIYKNPFVYMLRTRLAVTSSSGHNANQAGPSKPSCSWHDTQRDVPTTSEARKQKPLVENNEKATKLPRGKRKKKMWRQGIWISKNNPHFKGRSHCVICDKIKRPLKMHLKANHKQTARKPYFRCYKCYKNFYLKVIFDYHKNFCKDTPDQ